MIKGRSDTTLTIRSGASNTLNGVLATGRMDRRAERRTSRVFSRMGDVLYTSWRGDSSPREAFRGKPPEPNTWPCRLRLLGLSNLSKRLRLGVCGGRGCRGAGALGPCHLGNRVGVKHCFIRYVIFIIYFSLYD